MGTRVKENGKGSGNENKNEGVAVKERGRMHTKYICIRIERELVADRRRCTNAKREEKGKRVQRVSTHEGVNGKGGGVRRWRGSEGKSGKGTAVENGRKTEKGRDKATT